MFFVALQLGQPCAVLLRLGVEVALALIDAPDGLFGGFERVEQLALCPVRTGEFGAQRLYARAQLCKLFAFGGGVGSGGGGCYADQQRGEQRKPPPAQVQGVISTSGTPLISCGICNPMSFSIVGATSASAPSLASCAGRPT